jgi:beta-glucosidase
VLELKGFQRIHLEPGEARDVVFELTSHELSMLNARLQRVVEPGTFRILVGASSQDIRLRGEVIVQ